MNAIQDHELVLDGCAPMPLAGYLKALGVLRLLGEQKPEWVVRGAWRGDRFVLKSEAFTGDAREDRQRLTAFFLDEYRPTPIVAPWNGGSGFFPGDNRKGMDALADSKSGRFADYRQAIRFGCEVVDRLGFIESPKAEAKAEFLTLVRGCAPEALLTWMDAAILLAGDEPRYPPLLGTGGNDGRLDFTNNFMQRLTELLDPTTGNATPGAHAWLPAALFGETAPGMKGAAIGQFDPGGAGGPNASTSFEAESLINPWDFVLMLEGALFFAAAATRRLEAAEPGMLAYPFTVRPAGAGNGGIGPSDEAQARAEIWLPLWPGFASAGEIKALLAEGRATLGRRPVRDGLGFSRAVAALGVDRGIAAFQRYGFLMRSGKAYLATPLTRVAVRRNPDADLIEDLEAGHFLDRLRQFARKDETSSRIRSRVRLLEDALFELTQRAEPSTLQNVLVHMGALSLALGKSRKAREEVPPVPTLSEAWVVKADDGSPEFRCATALAGLYGAGLPMRPFVVPVQQEKHGGWGWHPESRLAVWGEGGLIANLGRVVTRRQLEALRQGADVKPFQFNAGAASGDVAAVLSGQLDEDRLAALVAGLVHTRIPERLVSVGETTVLPAAYCALKPFFAPDALLSRFLPPERTLSLPGEIVARLQAGRVQEAVGIAWRRLRAAGFPLPRYPKTPPSAQGLEGLRLLAALAIPLEPAELTRCMGAVAREILVETA